MKNIVLRYGVIAGVVFIALMFALAYQCVRGTFDFQNSEIVGYSAMILAFITVFIGIRRYREHEGGGAITFGKGFQIGILITLIACAFYVVSWEIVYYNFVPDFADTYANHVIEKLQRDGASDATIARKMQELNDFRRWYKNPLLNAGMTLMEVLPVGVIVTLVSAAILRRKSESLSV